MSVFRPGTRDNCRVSVSSTSKPWLSSTSYGVDSPLLFGYLPRLSIHHEELRQAIASQVAAQETLDAHGPAGTPEAIKAQGLFPQELVGRGSHPSRRDRPKPLRLDTAIPGHRPSNSHAA